MEHMPERRGGDRTKQTGKTSQFAPWSREVVAKTFKVSDKSVQQAKAILSEAPDLAEQVSICLLPLAAANAAAPGRTRHAGGCWRLHRRSVRLLTMSARS